jgi:DNA-binding Lrp family transcriptional regulator
LPTRAFILIETEVGRARQVAESLRSVPGVLAADVITGSFDVIATIEASSMSAMAEVITGQVQSIRGVLRTITCVSAG